MVKVPLTSVRLPLALRQALQQRAKDESRSLSNLIIKLLQEAMK